MGKLFKDGINSINSTLIQTITDLQNLRPVIEDMRQELDHTFGMTDTASGSVASFSDGAGGVAVKDVKTTIEPVQNLNGYTHPWVGGAGKNILSPFVVGINISTSNGQQSGSPASSSTNSATDYIPVENANYVLSKDGTIDSHNTIPYFYNANKEYLGRKGGSATNPKAINIYDLNAETETMTNRTSASLPIAYVRIRTYSNSSSNPVVQTTIDSAKCQLEKGSSATTYEPYENICPITGWDLVKIANDPKLTSFGSPDYYVDKDLGQTVYGGTLDLTTGVLTITHKVATITADMNIQKAVDDGYQTGVFTLADSVVSGKKYASKMNDIDTYASFMTKLIGTTSYANLTNGTYYWTSNSNGYWRFGFGTPSTTLQEFKDYITANRLDIVCELATPVTYQLTPEQLYQFTLDNNIFSDCGTVEVTYRLNLATAISRLQGA